MAFLEQAFKPGQFLRLDGSHFDARSGLVHTIRRCSGFRWRFHPTPSQRKTRKRSSTKVNPSTSAPYKTQRRNPGPPFHLNRFGLALSPELSFTSELLYLLVLIVVRLGVENVVPRPFRALVSPSAPTAQF